MAQDVVVLVEIFVAHQLQVDRLGVDVEDCRVLLELLLEVLVEPGELAGLDVIPPVHVIAGHARLGELGGQARIVDTRRRRRLCEPGLDDTFGLVPNVEADRDAEDHGQPRCTQRRTADQQRRAGHRRPDEFPDGSGKQRRADLDAGILHGLGGRVSVLVALDALGDAFEHVAGRAKPLEQLSRVLGRPGQRQMFLREDVLRGLAPKPSRGLAVDLLQVLHMLGGFETGLLHVLELEERLAGIGDQAEPLPNPAGRGLQQVQGDIVVAKLAGNLEAVADGPRDVARAATRRRLAVERRLHPIFGPADLARTGAVDHLAVVVPAVARAEIDAVDDQLFGLARRAAAAFPDLLDDESNGLHGSPRPATVRPLPGPPCGRLTNLNYAQTKSPACAGLCAIPSVPSGSDAEALELFLEAGDAAATVHQIARDAGPGRMGRPLCRRSNGSGRWCRPSSPR